MKRRNFFSLIAGLIAAPFLARKKAPLPVATSAPKIIQTIPVGTVQQWIGQTLPNGYLWCEGQSLQSSSFPELYNCIGTAYGSVQGGQFNVPDLRPSTFVIKSGGSAPTCADAPSPPHSSCRTRRSPACSRSTD